LARLRAGRQFLRAEVLLSTIDKAFDSYQYGTVSLAANKAITDDVSFYVSGNFSANTEDDTLDFDIDNFPAALMTALQSSGASLEFQSITKSQASKKHPPAILAAGFYMSERNSFIN